MSADLPSSGTHRGYGAQIRRSSFFEATVRYVCRGFSVYNHMYIPRDFGDAVENYWNLVERLILCDFSVERQVEITGPDALQFTRLLTPRNLDGWRVGTCKYGFITDERGGLSSFSAAARRQMSLGRDLTERRTFPRERRRT